MSSWRWSSEAILKEAFKVLSAALLSSSYKISHTRITIFVYPTSTNWPLSGETKLISMFKENLASTVEFFGEAAKLKGIPRDYRIMLKFFSVYFLLLLLFLQTTSKEIIKSRYWSTKNLINIKSLKKYYSVRKLNVNGSRNAINFNFSFFWKCSGGI